MATIYIQRSPGPWYCDDTAVPCDGITSDTTDAWPFGESLPTVDGVGPNRRRRRNSEHRGMVRAADTAGTSHAKDK